MGEIVKLIKNGTAQYPITKPEAVIDENGQSLNQLLNDKADKAIVPTKLSQLEKDIEIGTDYDDSELRNQISMRNVMAVSTDTEITDILIPPGFTIENGVYLPLRYPDLSTQPSVLPYMCMGNYIFEYLMPYNNSNTIICNLEYNKPLILSCDIIGVGIKVGCNVLSYSNGILVIDPLINIQSNDPLFIKISYTALEKLNACDPDDYCYTYYTK